MTRSHVEPGRPMRGRRHLLPTVAVVVTASAIGCASGSSGAGNSGNDAMAIPDQTRTVMRIGNYAPVEMWTEPGVGARTIQVAPELAWRVLGGVYSEMNIPVTATNPQAMQLGNGGYPARRIGGKRMNSFIDCGSDLSGPLANQLEITLTITTKLTAKEEGATEVLTTLDAWGEPRAVSGNPMHCQSRGVLELDIAKAVAEALGVTP